MTQKPFIRAPLLGFLFLFPAISASAPKAPADVDLKIQVQVPSAAVVAGSAAEAVMTLTPPAGIAVNQYPPIRVTLEKSSSVVFDPLTVKVGLDAMPDDPEENPFKSLVPIPLKFRVAEHAKDGEVTVKGMVKFFYCIKRSGFCAPATKPVSFKIPVATRTAAR